MSFLNPDRGGEFGIVFLHSVRERLKVRAARVYEIDPF